MIHLVFIGAPGSGKGTQSAKLSASIKYNHVSTGDLLRLEIEKKSDLGNRVKSIMDAGNLVSDEIVAELLKANLDLDSNGYIFDGYPRNIKQAKVLVNDIITGRKFKVIYFRLDPEKLVKRLSNRRVSKDGKHIYNLITNPPKVDGICDVTGEKLYQRDDDKEDVVRSRLEIFVNSVDPVISYFKSMGCLIEIDADRSVEDVYNEIIASIS